MWAPVKVELLAGDLRVAMIPIVNIPIQFGSITGLWVVRRFWATKKHLSNQKKAPFWLGFVGDYTTQLCGDYYKAFIRMPIQQPVE